MVGEWVMVTYGKESMEKQRPLTDEELDAVTDVIATEGEVSGLVALWAVLLGYPLANHPGQLRPGDYAIPEVQWRKIAAAMIATKIEVTNFPGFTMVNTGPNGYEPAFEPATWDEVAAAADATFPDQKIGLRDAIENGQ